jgi:nucleoid DNA-binding protein
VNKEELVTTVHEALGSDVSRSQAETAVKAILEGIAKGLREDRTVQLTGFGTFNVSDRKERMGRNPRTGEPIRIEASRTVVFRPGKHLKEDL